MEKNEEIQAINTDNTTETTSYTPYELINFENGTLVSPGKIDLETCEITMPVYSGKAPMNATNLNHLEQGIKNLEVYILDDLEKIKNNLKISRDENNNTILFANENSIFFRPNGQDSTTGQVYINQNGELYLPETTRIFSGNEKILTHSVESHQTTLSSNGANIYFRPNGGDSDVAQIYITPSGNMNVAGSLFSNAFYLKDGNKAIVSTSVHIVNIVKNSKVYLEVGTNNIDGVGSWGVDVWASDKRLKNSIKDTKVNALDIIRKIKHREFKYNNNDNLVKIGYVADELQEIDDELIFEVGEDKLKQPSTSYIIPLLSKAIQEQQEQIEKLKKEIESLKKES